MPTKDIDKYTELIEILRGTLYLNDNPIMELDKFEIVKQASEEFTIEEPKSLNIDWSKECTIILENVQINKNSLLSVMLGRKDGNIKTRMDHQTRILR